MDRLRRSFRESFRRRKDRVPESSKPHQWQADDQAVRSGTCSFSVKYMGCVEVFESRGMQVCEEALKVLRVSVPQKSTDANYLNNLLYLELPSTCHSWTAPREWRWTACRRWWHQGPYRWPDHREGELLCARSCPRAWIQLHLPWRNDSSLDVSRIRGHQRFGRTSIACCWVRVRRVFGA